MSISILMSVYGSEKPCNLDASLRSIWSEQTLKPDQIILVEDGRLGPELHEVIERWKNELSDKLTIIVNAENIGLTKSLNKAIELAKGDYIARMDSDDVSLPERFALQKAYLDANPDIMVLGTSIQEFNSVNDNLGIRRYPLDNDTCRRYICKANPLAHPTVMIRRKIFDDGLRYDERYQRNQDLALWIDVIAAGYKISNIEDVTLKFRREDKMFSRRKSKETKNSEFRIYSDGIRRIHGALSYRYIYPITRYIFRSLPVGFIRFIYGSKMRKQVLR